MEQKLIKLEQVPVIDFKGLNGISELVDKRISALSLDSIVATQDSLKSIKEIRSTLNKEFSAYDNARKDIKKKIAEPYTIFESEFKSKISSRYKDADEFLKDKILSVENDLKKDKETKLRSFFNEKCLSLNIDFLSFENVGLKVNLSATDKSLKEKIVSYVEIIANDINVINALANNEDYKTDVLIEYKINLDLKRSLDTIKFRYEQKAKVKEAKETPIMVAKEEPKEAVKEEVKAPLQAPVEESLIKASFTVKAPLQKLKELKQYIIDNNIEIL